MADFHGGEMAALDAEDLQEEEVWAVMNPGGPSKTNPKTRKKNFSSSSSGRRSSAIPRAAASGAAASRSSAPVHITDWSKILKKNRDKNLWDDDPRGTAEDDDDGLRDGIHGKDDEEDDVGGGEMVPPHEYLARRLASTQIASFSMCEGVGGTLKGRDLSRLRNAILTKTGFIE